MKLNSRQAARTTEEKTLTQSQSLSVREGMSKSRSSLHHILMLQPHFLLFFAGHSLTCQDSISHSPIQYNTSFSGPAVTSFMLFNELPASSLNLPNQILSQSGKAYLDIASSIGFQLSLHVFQSLNAGHIEVHDTL